MRSFWKLLPLALLAAIGLVAVSGLPGAPPRAEATIDDITGPTSMVSGSTVTIHVESTLGTNGDTEITASGGNSRALKIIDCDSPECDSDEGVQDTSGSTVSVTVDSVEGVNDIELELTATCDEGEDITVSASDDDGDVAEDLVIECVEPNVVIIKDADGAGSQTFSFTISGTSNECDDSFELGDGETAGYVCDEPGEYTVTEVGESGWDLADITCDESGGGNATINESARRVDIELDSSGSVVECTFTNSESGGGEAKTISVATSFASLGCGNLSVISVTVRDASSNPVAGASVNVTANVGSVSPSPITTSATGFATTFYTAPASGAGTATITATVAGTSPAVTGTVNITLTCAAATATTAPAPTATRTGGALGAPATGDAGLSGGSGTDWTVYAGLVLLAGSLIGAVAALRLRA
jgi:hypothetical protein